MPSPLNPFQEKTKVLFERKQMEEELFAEKEQKTHQAIGGLKERYPRVARYDRIDFDNQIQRLVFEELSEEKTVAEKLDGSYVIKTDRKDMRGDEIWRSYILITRIETASRNMKSPPCERAIFYQLEYRA